MTRAPSRILAPWVASKSWRRMLVFLHVLSSVSWMSQAAALAVLLGVAAGTGPREQRLGAALSATVLDDTVLVHSADVSAATGLLLAAATSWGFWVHRWVAIKLVATIGQLYLGIFVLSGTLDDSVAAVRAGQTGPSGWLSLAAALMAGAFAAQVWISIAKPGGKTRLGRSAARPHAAGAPVLAAATLAPVGDVALGLYLGHPAPVASSALILVLVVYRARAVPQGERRAPQQAEKQYVEKLTRSTAPTA